jgi:cobyrinic acid a,c-diamide synthase
VIGGTKSGCGKTTISLGLMAALSRRGLRVAPFKVGPDFIDPGHHTRIVGAVSKNLDGWMLSKEYNLECFRRTAQAADVAVIEGVMGLFDGYDGKSEAGSTAQMAKWIGAPVILLVDAASMARSAAAVVMGFEHFDEQLNYAGVILNNLGSQRHLQYLADAMQERIKMPCLGGIIRNENIAIPERHLGLVTREDHPLTRQTIDGLADIIEKNIDLDMLLNALPEINLPRPGGEEIVVQEKKVRIAVARDNAFCFYYQDNLELLEQHGAEIISFSPLTDGDLPQDVDGLYLGGGYPELFAGKLAENSGLRDRIRSKSRDGMPIYGECGGFMYLCEELVDQNNASYPMAGCFPFATKMFPRLKALGYREITLTGDTTIGKRGIRIRGHEFHYSELTRLAPGFQTVYQISDRSGLDRAPEGYQISQTLGSYNHLHFGSEPTVAGHFVENCRKYNHSRNLGY